MSEIVIVEDDDQKVEVRLETESVWLSQAYRAELFKPLHSLKEQGLTALTLLIAESDPKAKDLMVRLTMNLVAEAAPQNVKESRE